MRNLLINIFAGVKDPRKIDRCVYELGDLLAVAEDRLCRARRKKAAHNLSLLRKLVLPIVNAINGVSII